MMDLKQIGIFIAELRKKKNMTQAALGNEVGVTGKAVSKWENGQSFPDISILNHLSEVLGVTATELLNGGYLDINHPESIDDVTENSINFYKKALKSRYIKIIVSLLIVILGLSLVLFYIYLNSKKNYCEMYTILSQDKQFKLSGIFISTNGKNIMAINNIKYSGTDINKVSNISYQLVNGSTIYFETKIKNRENIINISEEKTDLNEFLNQINIYIEAQNKKMNLHMKEDKTLRLNIEYENLNGHIDKIYIPIKLERQFSSTKIKY